MPSERKFVTVRPGLLNSCLWILFGLGLLLQAFSAHLRIEHNAFVLPPAMANSPTGVNASELIGRERTLQSLSALLVLTGAIGLGFYYRRSLLAGFAGTGDNLRFTERKSLHEANNNETQP